MIENNRPVLTIRDNFRFTIDYDFLQCAYRAAIGDDMTKCNITYDTSNINEDTKLEIIEDAFSDLKKSKLIADKEYINDDILWLEKQQNELKDDKINITVDIEKELSNDPDRFIITSEKITLPELSAMTEQAYKNFIMGYRLAKKG